MNPNPRVHARRVATSLAVVGIAATLALVPAASALAAPISDNFDRANGTDLGAPWVETGTDLEILGNAVTNAATSYSTAIAIGGTGDTVAADIAAGAASSFYATLVLRASSASDGVFVQVEDATPADGLQQFTRVSFRSGNFGGAIALAPPQDITPFSSARVTAGISGSTVYVAVDTDFDGVAEQVVTVVISSVPLGTGVGFGLSGGTLLDDFASGGPAPTVIDPSSDPATAVRGSGTLTVYAVSTGGTPTGDVVLEVPGEPDQTTAFDASGAATFSLADIPVGTTTYRAVYAGAGSFVGSAFAGSITISKAPSTVALTSSPASSTPGQAVTLTAAVTGATGLAPTGTVSFYDGSTLLAGGVPIVAGRATLALSTLAGGSHSITAVYAGDVDHLGATSAARSHVVGDQLAVSGPDAATMAATIGAAAGLIVLGLALLIATRRRPA